MKTYSPSDFFKMLKICIFATVLLVSVSNAADEQEEFVRNLIYKFPNYVQENGLDPSEIYTEPVEIRRPNDVANFTNHQLFGHFGANASVEVVIFRIPTETRLGMLALGIYLGNPNTTIEGNYSINGRLDWNETYSAQGRWTIRPQSHYIVNIDFYDIPLSEDGNHVDLKNAGEKSGMIWNATVDQMDYKMEGLVAGGHEELITIDNMRELFHRFLYNADLPMPKQLMQFFEDEFEKIPISDMTSMVNRKNSGSHI